MADDELVWTDWGILEPGWRRAERPEGLRPLANRPGSNTPVAADKDPEPRLGRPADQTIREMIRDEIDREKKNLPIRPYPEESQD